jgi:hypothetical protein
MATKASAINVLVVVITIAALSVALLQSVMPIGVNSGRINNLQNVEASIQNLVSQIARDPTGANAAQLRTQLEQLNTKREEFIAEINTGKRDAWGIPPLECIFPLKASCFVKNDSEHNNLFIAVGSGVLGACFLLLLQARRRAVQPHNAVRAGELVEAVCVLAAGLLAGLLVLYLIRGTKGVLSSPISGVVQIENPYGIAFASTVGGLFSERIVGFLTGLLDRVARDRPAGNEQNPADRP